MIKHKNPWVAPDSAESGLQDIGDPAEISAILHSLENSGAKLGITLPTSQETFATLLVGLDDRAGYFYIDELIPFAGNDLLTPGVALAVRIDNHGVKICFDARVVETGDTEGEMFHSCELPRRLLLTQKRRHYRVGFRIPDRPSISLQTDQGWLERVKLNDLSSKGAGFTLRRLPQGIEQGKQLYCRIFVHGQEFPFQARLSHVTERSFGKGWQLGLSFREDSMSPAFQRRLAKYMMDIQRQRIRHVAGSSE